MTPDTPILQFGTSRFLLAHADLFVSQALDKGEAVIVFDPDSQQCQLALKRDVPKDWLED